MENTDKPHKIYIISCGILSDEVNFLIKKNHLKIDPFFLSSSLHVDFSKLGNTLKGALKKSGNDIPAVIYGTCHPDIDNIVSDYNGLRTDCRNCVELLLGKEIFTDFLSDGAFFLLKDWVDHWDEVMNHAFGKRPDVIKEVLKSEHKYFLGIRTPCSGDFSDKAEKLSSRIGLPLRWYNAGLENMEKIILNTIKKLETGKIEE